MIKNYFNACAIGLGYLVLAAPAMANEPKVVKAVAQCSQQSCRFDVTLKHQDEGWDHYANQWQVTTISGVVLGTRTLHHPHVNEQPFTRSLSGVEIPLDTKQVLIVPRDSVHGSGKAYSLTIAD